MLKRVLLTLVSVLMMGVTLSVLNIVNWGMDSFSYMNISIANKIGWSMGNWQMLLNIIMFIPVVLWGRKYLGLGTIFNMVLVGYTLDFCTWIWQKVNLEALLVSAPVRAVVMLLSVVAFVFVAAIYMSTELGTSPFDALPMMIGERFPKMPFTFIRFGWDLTAVVIGFLLSGKVQIVTILMVLFLGKTISFVKGHIGKILN